MTNAEALAMNKKFTVDISRWVAAAKGKVDDVVRKVLYDVSTAIIMRTPVDTGRLRGNWQFGVDSIPSGETGNVSPPNFSAQIGAATAGHTYYIVNNLPYAAVIEYGQYPNPPKGGSGKTSGGYSTQAPQGMVRITVVEYEKYLREAVIKVRAQ